MRGNIRQRAKGTFTLTLGWRENGELKQSYHTVKGTKREAENKLAELIHLFDTGQYFPSDKTTVRDFLGRWLKDYAWPNLSPETAQVYEIIINRHLIPALGSITLQKLTPDRIQAYYSEKLANGRVDGKGGLSPRTVRHHHRLLHVALGNAVKWRLIQRNPTDAVDAPKYRQKDLKIFDQDSLASFLNSISNSEYYALFHCLLFTGLRRSEALALRWKDVDVHLGYVSVNRSLHQLNDKSFVFQQPKTEKSRRLVALPPSASIVFRDHHDIQTAKRLLCGFPVGEEDLVFAHSDGSPLLPHSVTNAWKRLVKNAGFEGVRLHDARHSHATLMLKQGVNPKIVSERLGHASVVITLDTYSHVLPGLQEAAARGFDEMLNGHCESNSGIIAVPTLTTSTD